jgi:hypothetical protein
MTRRREHLAAALSPSSLPRLSLCQPLGRPRSHVLSSNDDRPDDGPTHMLSSKPARTHAHMASTNLDRGPDLGHDLGSAARGWAGGRPCRGRGFDPPYPPRASVQMLPSRAPSLGHRRALALVQLGPLRYSAPVPALVQQRQQSSSAHRRACRADGAASSSSRPHSFSSRVREIDVCVCVCVCVCPPIEAQIKLHRAAAMSVRTHKNRGRWVPHLT